MKHENVIDKICSLPGIGGTTCVFILDALPLIVQILSIVSLFLSISWFVYRYYKETKRND